MLITLAEKSGGSQQLSFEKNEITIGRLAGNDIVLAKGNVSKYHSRIVAKDGKFIIVDMKSTNGTYVNGKKIAAPQVIKPSDKIYIGDYILNVGQSDGEVVASVDSMELADPAEASLSESPPAPSSARAKPNMPSAMAA